MKKAADYLPTRYWLLKTEPETFSFDDLLEVGKEGEPWDGIRNYQARNFMRDNMEVGDKIIIYHSNTTPPGIAGLAEVVAPAEPDVTAFDPKSKYYDPKSKKDNPTWVCVRVGKAKKLKNYVSLTELRESGKSPDMLLLRKGQRLSIQPLCQEEFEDILELAN